MYSHFFSTNIGMFVLSNDQSLNQGPFSLTSLLLVKLLAFQAATVSYSVWYFCCKKCEKHLQKLRTFFFSKNIDMFDLLNDKSFNQGAVCLTSLLLVKLLTVLATTISNSLVFLPHFYFFSAKILTSLS